ncbi:hypothetical protein C7B61_19615 [filamentous cyanobacterium CCP1]|nr:hypothetical protein C7B76_27265 [filamentous cyanobacterium CCP2]PSB57898.1 hypothetical protein C7B61_19615 [filamentous cyanobacterium CCP1]
MLDFINFLFEFSRTHCVAICAALVPANLLATSQTMIFAGLGRPIAQVHLMAKVSSLYALLILLHVFTWWAIGVIMAPTYILTFLGCLCLLTNLGAVAIATKGISANRLVKLVELG